MCVPDPSRKAIKHQTEDQSFFRSITMASNDQEEEDGGWETYSTQKKKKKLPTPSTQDDNRSDHHKNNKRIHPRKKNANPSRSSLLGGGPSLTSKSWSRPQSLSSNESTTLGNTIKKDEGTTNIEKEEEDKANCRSNPLQTPASLETLLQQEYGEYDPHWNQQPTSNNENTVLGEPVDHDTNEDDDMDPQNDTTTWHNQLRVAGKAPIHVEFVSFGYHYGIPATATAAPAAWSSEGNHDTTTMDSAVNFAQPLPVVDTTDYPTAPSHLQWQDGLSGLIRRILLTQSREQEPQNDKNHQTTTATPSASKDVTTGSCSCLRELAQDLAKRVANALVCAMTDGGYGYAKPLNMTIHVASDYGRHRSVVAVEAAATALRQLLRKSSPSSAATTQPQHNNNNNKKESQWWFPQPVSVGTRHTDMNKTIANKRQNQPMTKRNTKAHKNIMMNHHQRDDDNDW